MDDFLDPTGALEIEQHPVAPRLSTLKGTTLAICDNGKTNGDKFLKLVFEELQQRYGVERYVIQRKRDLSQPAPHEMIVDLAKEADFAITGIGD